jgi:predicted metalloprotease
MLGFMLLRMVFTRFGIGGVVIAVGGFVLLSMLGVNPLTASGGGGGSSRVNDAYDQEIAAVLASTEDVWTQQFAANGLGDYPEPRLNLFAGGIQTQGCGFASSAVGPFYCPGGRQIYIDTGFFDQLANQLGAGGDFARAYVIAHEVGHHVQTVTGISQEVQRRQAAARSESERNAYSVRLELMADCFAGVWASNTAAQRGFDLEEGDLQEGLRAANAIGDDALSGGRARPDNFTHGTSEQRQRWLSTGYRTGDMNACDTLSGEAV